MRRALDVERLGLQLEDVDRMPKVIATADLSNLLSAASFCAKSGVLAIVGDETTARRAIADAWK